MNFRGSAAVSAHEDRRSWTCIELTLLRTRFTDRPGAVRAKPRSRMSLKLEIHLRDRLRGRSSEVRRRLTEQEKVIAGLCVKPSDGLEPSTPSLPSRVVGKRWQRPAARRKDLCGFWRVAPCPWLRLFASALLHKCSTQAAGVGAALGCEAV